MPRSYHLLAWALLLVSLAHPASTFGALQPGEIAIIAAKDSRESKAVAAYYAKIRQVPTENILNLEFPTGRELARDVWTSKVRPEIQRWLSTGDRQQKIRCLVTVWDVPLTIGAEADNHHTRAIVKYLTREREQRVTTLMRFLERLRQIAGDGAPAMPAMNAETPLADIQKNLDQMFAAAQATTSKMQDKSTRDKTAQQLQLLYVRSVGMGMMVQSLSKQLQSATTEPPAQFRTEFDFGRGRVTGLREGRIALEGLPFSLEREPQLLAVIQVSDGVFGTIGWLDEMISVLKKNESFASFDSELSLVGWDDYQLVRWQPNVLHYRYDDSPVREYRKTYMVARLEAPTLKRTRELIDQAVAVEKDGLRGKVYLDARGLAKLDENVPSGGYPDYDQSLLRAADLIKNHTDLEVVLDTSQDLFQPGSASQAALYCGWYSLAKYVDAFEWQPGAVGYHMASAEASTLRDAESQVWCKRMLEDGVVATIGPTQEPYITAFPRPNEFFALLLSGKYTLAEAYYRSLPFTSWTMTLVGDPLYQPFQKSPPLRREGLDAATLRMIDGTAADMPEMAASAAPTEKPATEKKDADLPTDLPGGEK